MHSSLRISGWSPGLGPVAIAALALWLALGAGSARAQGPAALETSPPPVPLSQAAAEAQLEEARAAFAPAPAGAEPAPVRDVTAELRDLSLALPYLRGAKRRQARALLARPPNCALMAGCPQFGDGNGPNEPFGAGWSPADTLTRQHEDLDHFRIHWVESGPHAPSAQLLDWVRDFAEHAYDVQNGQLGWPTAKSDQGIGGNNLVDIYLADICADDFNPCVFGYAASEPSVPGCAPPTYRCAAYLVLDNDYAEFDRPMKALKATLAHEYNHILQFRIDVAMDRWVFESTATWMEEQVFPRADDWVRTYLPAWARTSRQAITNDNGRRQYGSAVWNHWLTRRFGADAVLNTWWSARKTRPKHFGVGAYELGINQAGGRGFGLEFTRFAAATAEWRAGKGRFPDRRDASFVDVRRFGALRSGGRSRFRLNHTAYILKRVRPGNADRLRLRVRAPAGTRSGIALIGRRGGARQGKVISAVKYLNKGGTGVVTLRGARRFRRITAVIVNADGRMRRNQFGWRYAHDRKQYVAKLRAR